MIEKINEFFNSKAVETEWTNEYIIKIQSTVKPKENYTFNEQAEHIHKQFKLDL